MKEASVLLEHGVLGAVIGALFVVVGWFLKALSRKDAQNQRFIEKLLDADRSERTQQHKLNAETTNKLSNAINDLTRELRNGDRA